MTKFSTTTSAHVTTSRPVGKIATPAPTVPADPVSQIQQDAEELLAALRACLAEAPAVLGAHYRPAPAAVYRAPEGFHPDRVEYTDAELADFHHLRRA
jgi:hypothetical protein